MKNISTPAAGNPPPHGIKVAAVQRYLSAFEAPRAANRRLLSVLVFIALSTLALAVGIMLMLPLKERVPYFVTVNPNSGAVTASDQIATRFNPSQTSVRYFLAQWVTNLLSVDDTTQATRLPASYAMLRGTALDEWRHFIFEKWQPLKQLKDNPQLRIYPTVDAVGMLGDDSAVIRVSLHNSQGEYGKHLLVTVKFAILPPQTDAEIYRNPIGLWITHFEVSNESPGQ